MKKTKKMIEFSYKLKEDSENDAGNLAYLREKNVSLNVYINASMMYFKDMDNEKHKEIKLIYIAKAEKEIKK